MGKPGGNPLKYFFEQYGRIAVGVHIANSLISFSGCYLAISRGVDVESWLRSLGFGFSQDPKDPDVSDPTLLPSEGCSAGAGPIGARSSGGAARRSDESSDSTLGTGIKAASSTMSTLAIAWLCHKALTPVRLSITLGVTPIVARVIRKRRVKP